MFGPTLRLPFFLGPALALSMGVPGCASRGPANAVGTLQGSATAADLSPYEPRNPMAQVVPGMVGRTIGQAATSGYRVEAREFIVGPGPRRVDVALTAAGVFEVTSGSGTVTTGNLRRDLAAGTTFATPDDQTVSIENPASVPLHLRVYVFVGQ